MSVIDQITYWTRDSSKGLIYPVASSIRNKAESDSWQPRLAPWLQVGRPPGRAYLNFGRQAAMIRWNAASGPQGDQRFARVLVGDPAALTARFGLEVADVGANALDGADRSLLIMPGERGPLGTAIEARARTAEAFDLLIPLLAHALEYRRRVTMPLAQPGIPEAVLWGFTSILDLIGSAPPVSFLTSASGPAREGDLPGLFISFSEGTRSVLPPDEGFRKVAVLLAEGFRDDPDGLRQALAEHGVFGPADYRERVRLLSTLPARRPAAQARAGAGEATNAGTRGSRTVNANLGTSQAATWPAPTGPGVVKCPMCLYQIEDWEQLDRWRWDGVQGDYEKITLPPDANDDERRREMHGAYVCCPRSQKEAAQDQANSVHYLPANYGSFGDPVLLGFVGLSKSGKTHLLTSMIARMGELSRYRITSYPLDPLRHRRFLDESVRPLMSQNQVLPGTPEDVRTEFADAFIITHASGKQRVVVLFDVAGEDLAQTDKRTKEFLWIAHGLFFVIDPDNIIASVAGGDQTFTNVLNVVRDRPSSQPVSAAVILNKADKVRFENPVARWLRSADKGLDATEFLRESADVYAYLDRNDAAMLAEEPYHACSKTTLHVASPTGGAGQGEGEGSQYPRGVMPMRVLRPLVAMLAMTGVLTGPEAVKVGV
jgi:hypothetical protein